MTVFLDTVGLLAVWDESDQWHPAAQACFSGLLSRREDLVTSSFVLLECGNAAARKPYRSAVSQLRKQMEPGHHLIAPTDDDWQAAWLAYERGEADSAGGGSEYPKHLPTTGISGRLDLRRCFESIVRMVHRKRLPRSKTSLRDRFLRLWLTTD